MELFFFMLAVSACTAVPLELPGEIDISYLPADDVNFPEDDGNYSSLYYQDFKYKWIAMGGIVYKDKFEDGMLEVAGTLGLSEQAFQVGASIIGKMVKNMPDKVFLELARRASVGLFTKADKTTIFPEYQRYRDRPECRGSCAGSCRVTCTGDGRKYDSLAGVGGTRGTCVDDNVMCSSSDPYRSTYSVLVHEFGHTIHQHALPFSSSFWNDIYSAWSLARQRRTWDTSSYAMSNHLEYFAEGTGTFFHVNHHFSSSGGMNSCGRPYPQKCQSETEAREWLASKDPGLYAALTYTYTNNRDYLPGGIKTCPYL